MIWYCEVNNFVGDKVAQDEVRCHDEPPVKRQIVQLMRDQALPVARDPDPAVKDRLLEGRTLKVKGMVLERQGKYQQALDTYNEARIIFDEVSSPSDKASTLNGLGLVYHKLARYQEAATTYKDALTIAQSGSAPDLVPIILNNLGATYQEIGDLVQAIDYHEQGKSCPHGCCVE